MNVVRSKQASRIQNVQMARSAMVVDLHNIGVPLHTSARVIRELTNDLNVRF